MTREDTLRAGDDPREQATPDPSELGGEQLTRFYDRLRRRIAEPLAGKVGTPLADTLLLAPDLFVLLVRLFTDQDLDVRRTQALGIDRHFHLDT